MIKKIYIIVVTLVVTIAISNCAYAVRYDGPYEGRVIDVDTGQPLEGVVVLGVWYAEIITPAGASHNFYDAKETVTDKNGEFLIEGLGLKLMSRVAPMDVLIFKAGYTSFGKMTWKELTRTFKHEGNKPIIRLRKLTMEQRKKMDIPNIYIGERTDERVTQSCIPKNIKLLPQEVNKELMEQGRKPLDLDLQRQCEK